MDGNEPIRFRQMYLKAHDIESGEFDGCNENEIKELLCRKSLEDWLLDTPEAR